MLNTARRYADWKAPCDDGGLLVWPGRDELADQTRENQKRLGAADGVRIQNVGLSELRSRQREWLGLGQGDRPVVGTGHQCELYHPGVWIKLVAIDALSGRLGGEAVHFAVDTDEPKHLQLRWPQAKYDITDDPAVNSAAWSGLVSGPSPLYLQQLQSEVDALGAAWGYAPMTGEVLGSMRRLALEPAPLPQMLTNATHALDWKLGLRHSAMLASPIWSSRGYLLFAHHVLARATEFGRDYNASLHEERAARRIRTPGRPMPDLKVAGDQYEVPFWLDDLARSARTRASVTICDGRGSLVWGGERFEFDASADGWEAAERFGTWLMRHQLRLAPRALTLTMFLRLCVVDQWIHGIGGGRYDQVLDRLIERHFRIDPPRFAVATATLFFPGAIGRQRVCLPCIKQQAHHVKHGALGEEKLELVKRIEALPRNSVQRAMAFVEMHRRLDSASHAVGREMDEKVRAAQQQVAQEQVLFDRELFYGIQSRERLEGLIGRCREEI